MNFSYILLISLRLDEPNGGSARVPGQSDYIIVLQYVEGLSKLFFCNWLLLADSPQLARVSFAQNKVVEIAVLKAHVVDFLTEVAMYALDEVGHGFESLG